MTPPPEGRPGRRAPAPPTAGDKVTGAIPWTIVPRVIQLVASLFTSVLVVRTLGSFDYGTLSVLRPLLFLSTSLIGFGMGQALNRFIPELRVTQQGQSARALLYRSLYLQSAIWLALSLLLVATRPLLVVRFPSYADLLILGVSLCIMEVAAGTLSQFAIASYRTGSMAVASGIGSMVQAGGTGLLLLLGMRVPAVLIGTAVGYGVSTLVLSGMLRQGAWKRSGGTGAKPFGARPPSVALPSPADGAAGVSWKRFLSYAVPWIPNYILTYLVWRQSETFLLGVLRTRVEAGLFDLAYKLPQLVLEFVPASVYPLVLAGFAETATVNKERMSAVITSFYQLLFFVVAPLGVFGLAMGDVLLVRLYGHEVTAAGPYCQAFFFIFTLSFFGTPLSMTVYVVEKVWINLVLNLGYAVVTIALDLILIPRYGLLGATIPTGLVTALTPFVRYAIARRYMDKIRIPWGFIGRAYLASSPLLTLFWLKRFAHSMAGLTAISLGAALFVLLSYRIFRVLGPEEKALLERSRIPGKAWILRLL